MRTVEFSPVQAQEYAHRGRSARRQLSLRKAQPRREVMQACTSSQWDEGDEESALGG